MHRLLIALAAGGVLAGAIYGAAASLGGITANDSLGADAAVISSCDTNGVNVFTSTGSTGSPARFRVRFVTVTGIDDDCLGKGAALFLTRAGVNIFPGGGGNLTATVVAPTDPAPDDNGAVFNLEILGGGPPVEDVEGIELQIGS